jgi:glucose/arabinose dehydrogenase
MIKHYLSFCQAKLQLLLLCIFSINHLCINAQPVINFAAQPSAGLSSVVDIVNAADGSGRLFIVERTGAIKIYNPVSGASSVFINLQDSIFAGGGEQGLLSLAFHPDFENNGYFFVYFTRAADAAITISRFRVTAGNPATGDGNSGVQLITVPKPSGFTNHNGGDLNFGPDGQLYAGLGDGGSGGDPFNNAQDGNSLLGKMLRLNVDNFLTPPYYTIPADNPYVANPLVRDEIWAIGLRNPWRWSFDRQTGDMWIADVGQGAREEINFRTAGNTGGINYGWRCYEGLIGYNTSGCAAQNTYISPIFDYPHAFANGGFSVSGGFVYRGTEYPVLNGYYICADFVSGNVWLIQSNGAGGWNVRQQTGLPGNISTFGEAEDGTLYAGSLGGTIYKIVVTSVLPVRLDQFTAANNGAYNTIQWKTLAEENLNRFVIEYSFTGQQFETAGEKQALNSPSGNQYNFIHPINTFQKIYYRLAMVDKDGNRTYSPVISIDPGNKTKTKIFPTLIKDHQLQMVLGAAYTEMSVFSSNGSLLLKKMLNGQTGYQRINLPALPAGYYSIQLKNAKEQETQQVYIDR